MEKKSIIKIGVYITIAFVILVWGVSYLKGESLFRKDNEYVAVYSRLEGLSESSPIMLSGYRIGTVKKLVFSDNGTTLDIFATLKINSDFALPKGTVAKIVSVDIMGTKGVEIVRPASFEEYHQNGDTILSGFDGGIIEMAMDMMKPINEHLGSILAAADSAMVQINRMMTDENRRKLEESLNGLNAMASTLSKNSQNIDNMIRSLSDLSNTMGKNSQNIDRAIGNFASLSDTLSEMNLGKTLSEAQTALRNVNQMLNTVNNGSGTAYQVLNNETLYNNLQTATEKINFLLDDFEKHPKKYVNLSIFGGKEKKEKNN